MEIPRKSGTKNGNSAEFQFYLAKKNVYELLAKKDPIKS